MHEAIILMLSFTFQYLECEADKKSSQLVDLLVKNKSKKIIMYVEHQYFFWRYSKYSTMLVHILDSRLIYDPFQLQLFYDLCLCWLLGGCSSSSCCFEESFINSFAWTDETGPFFSFLFADHDVGLMSSNYFPANILFQD